MKLDALFTSRDNSLFTVDGEAVRIDGNNSVLAEADSIPEPAQKDAPVFIQVPWSLAGLDEDSYNEAFLAVLRDHLKDMEEKKQFAVIVPVPDSDTDSPQKKEALTASMKHCARRIKDCASVIGFAIPAQADAEYFKAELSEKHSHYVFFTRNEEALKDKTVVRY